MFIDFQHVLLRLHITYILLELHRITYHIYFTHLTKMVTWNFLWDHGLVVPDAHVGLVALGVGGRVNKVAGVPELDPCG